MEWIAVNLGTIAVLVLVILAVILIVRKMIKDKKAGRVSCGCNCAHCAMAGTCHYKNKKPSEKRS